MAEKMFDVFLSYSKEDEPTAMQFAELLRAFELKVGVYRNKDKPMSKDFWEDFIIDSTQVAIALVGKDSLLPWQDSEINMVLTSFIEHGMPVIPVMVDGCLETPQLPEFLRGSTWIDCRDEKKGVGFNHLFSQITGQMPQWLIASFDWEADISAAIVALKIENWKSFDNATLHFDPFSVLIGTNSSGKSNALEALQFLNRAVSGTLLTVALQGDNNSPALRGGLEWAARHPGNGFALSIDVRADETTDYSYRIECEIKGNHCQLVAEELRRIKYALNNDQSTLISDDSYLYNTEPCEAHSPSIAVSLYSLYPESRSVSRSQSVLSQVVSQPLRRKIFDGIAAVALSLRGIFILDPIPSHMRDYSPLSDKLAPDARNIAGVLAAMPEAKRKETEDKLTYYASQLPERDIRRVYAEPVGKFKSDAMLYCEEHWIDEGEPPTVDARGMSDGTLRFLGILTALLTRPPGSLLVVEEVDNGLHPSRARLLLEMLRTVGGERRVDVLVTTHNPALLDAMETDLVPFITVAHRDFATGCSRLTLLEDLRQLPKLLAHGTVGRLSTEGLIEQALHSEDKA